LPLGVLLLRLTIQNPRPDPDNTGVGKWNET